MNNKQNIIKEGLGEIDLEIHDIDENIPDEVIEDDEEVEDLIRANKLLRDKVGEISDIVESAIEKASSLRKNIVTHRDQPADPELQRKLKEINRYQKAIMKIKYPHVQPNYKEKEIKDEIKSLKEEIKQLEEENIQ